MDSQRKTEKHSERDRETGRRTDRTGMVGDGWTDKQRERERVTDRQRQKDKVRDGAGQVLQIRGTSIPEVPCKR